MVAAEHSPLWLCSNVCTLCFKLVRYRGWKELGLVCADVWIYCIVTFVEKAERMRIQT